MTIKEKILNYKNSNYRSRTSLHNKITMFANFAWGFMKIVFAYFIHSFFLSISGFYTLCIALAKVAYFDGRKLSKNQFQEEKHFKRLASAIIGAGIVYLLYIIEIFLKTYQQQYTIIISISIATVAFCEIFFSLRGLIKSWKSKDLLLIGLKFINLSSALSSLVLTQVALLGLSNSTEQVILYNTILGVVVGIVTIAIGIYLFFYLRLFNKRHMTVIKQKDKAYYNAFNNKEKEIKIFKTLKLATEKNYGGNYEG